MYSFVILILQSGSYITRGAGITLPKPFPWRIEFLEERAAYKFQKWSYKLCTNFTVKRLSILNLGGGGCRDTSVAECFPKIAQRIKTIRRTSRKRIENACYQSHCRAGRGESSKTFLGLWHQVRSVTLAPPYYNNYIITRSDFNQ